MDKCPGNLIQIQIQEHLSNCMFEFQTVSHMPTKAELVETRRRRSVCKEIVPSIGAATRENLVIRVSNQVQHKPACTVIEAG